MWGPPPLPWLFAFGLRAVQGADEQPEKHFPPTVEPRQHKLSSPKAGQATQSVWI